MGAMAAETGTQAIDRAAELLGRHEVLLECPARNVPVDKSEKLV